MILAKPSLIGQIYIIGREIMLLNVRRILVPSSCGGQDVKRHQNHCMLFDESPTPAT